MRTYNLFISHSWAYSGQYERLLSLLRNRGYFRFRDYSVPRNDPIHSAGSIARLRQAIRQQMLPCSAILILAGMYAMHSRWINEEIYLAKRGFINVKPIIAIVPRGRQHIPSKVRAAADTIVKWNTESVVDAIRELA